MTKNPLTLKDVDPTQASAHAGIPKSPIIGSTANEVHNMGEVWCVALWDARANLINKLGAAAGNQMILQLVTDGMKLSPANPTFLQARDSIIQADLVNHGGANSNELWAAFAKRGMGSNATVPAAPPPPAWWNPMTCRTISRCRPWPPSPPAARWAGRSAPSSQIYTLTNQWHGQLKWTAATNQEWLADCAGFRHPGGRREHHRHGTVAAAAANDLAAGSYSATTTFINVTSGAACRAPPP